mgnify:CR=1 FL=1
MKPKISVIIPCYNSEQYIKRCVHSLISQTIGIENLELIFVNDASTDSTLSILKDFETQYPDNIIIVDLPQNRKQGAARNVGLNYASADYIGFIDSDDWIEEDMYAKLYSKMQDYNCDIVGCCKVDEYGEKSVGHAAGEELFLTINSVEDRKALLHLGNSGGIGSIFTKIYRKSLILDNGVYFPEEMAYEDNYWMAIILLHINSICIIKENLYHYCIHPGSTVTSINAKHHLDRLKIELMKLDKYSEKGVLDIYRNEIEIQFLNLFYKNTLHILFTKFTELPFNVIKFMQRVVLKEFPNYKSNPYFLSSHILYDPIFDTIELDWDEEQWNMFADEYRKIINVV